MIYKDMAFCPAKDCKNWNCPRNTDRPDFQPGGLPVCYADFKSNCTKYTNKLYENPQAGYCFSCHYFSTGITDGGKPVGFHGMCLNVAMEKIETEADDFCAHHQSAKWTKEK